MKPGEFLLDMRVLAVRRQNVPCTSRLAGRRIPIRWPVRDVSGPISHASDAEGAPGGAGKNLKPLSASTPRSGFFH